MSAQDRTEQVLRKFHILFSKAEPLNGSARDVVVDKIEAMELLQELNDCMYEMLDESGLSKSRREKANREMQRQGDEIIFSATRKAEDVYAASIMYTDNALRQIQDVVAKTLTELDKIHDTAKQQLVEEKRAIKKNQLDLKTQLESLIDTQKYLSLIEEDRRQQAKLAKDIDAGADALEEEENIYAGRQTEIRINEEYFRQQGIELDSIDDLDAEDEYTEDSQDADTYESLEEVTEQAPSAASWPTVSEIQQSLMSNDLDAEYFEWQQSNEPNTSKSEKKVFSLFSKK